MEIDPTADRTVSRFAAAEQDRGGLESLAGVASGEFLRIVGPDDDTLKQVAAASGGTVVATIDADASERTGRRDACNSRSREGMGARPP